ncbi:unnamed protein product [Ixodes pacificus]
MSLFLRERKSKQLGEMADLADRYLEAQEQEPARREEATLDSAASGSRPTSDGQQYKASKLLRKCFFLRQKWTPSGTVQKRSETEQPSWDVPKLRKVRSHVQSMLEPGRRIASFLCSSKQGGAGRSIRSCERWLCRAKGRHQGASGKRSVRDFSPDGGHACSCRETTRTSCHCVA